MLPSESSSSSSDLWPLPLAPDPLILCPFNSSPLAPLRPPLSNLQRRFALFVIRVDTFSRISSRWLIGWSGSMAPILDPSVTRQARCFEFSRFLVIACSRSISCRDITLAPANFVGANSRRLCSSSFLLISFVRSAVKTGSTPRLRGFLFRPNCKIKKQSSSDSLYVFPLGSRILHPPDITLASTPLCRYVCMHVSMNACIYVYQCTVM